MLIKIVLEYHDILFPNFLCVPFPPQVRYKHNNIKITCLGVYLNFVEMLKITKPIWLGFGLWVRPWYLGQTMVVG